MNDLIEIQEPISAAGTATFSPDQVYRYELTRTWDSYLPRIYWIMLNPSTADAFKNDHTITKVVQFSKNAGYGEAIILNLFAYRTPYPKKLYEAAVAGIDVIGSQNDMFIGGAFISGCPVVAAWGNHGKYLNRGTELLEVFPQVLVLDITKQGQPAHPLRLPYSLKFRKYHE